MTPNRRTNKTIQKLLAAIKEGDDYRRANPSAWSSDGYLMRPDSVCEHCGKGGLSESAWCGLCKKLVSGVGVHTGE